MRWSAKTASLRFRLEDVGATAKNGADDMTPERFYGKPS
jgi:hypothetical protein